MEHRREAQRNVLFGGLAAILFIMLMFAIFAITLMKDTGKQVAEYLDQTTAQDVIIAQNKIDDTFSYLKNMAAVISEYEEINGQKTLLLLQENERNSMMSYMAVSLPNGNSFSPGRAVISVADREYFQKSMRGENVLSERLISRYDSLECVVFSVPIWKGKKVSGVLRCTYHLEQLRKLLLTQRFGEGANILVVRNDGSIITPPREKTGEYDMKYFDRIKTAEGTAAQSLLYWMKKGQSASFPGTLNGQRFLLQVAPIGRGNWYIVAAVPARLVYAQSSKTIYEVLALMIGIVFILVLWSTYFFRTQIIANKRIYKNEKAMEALVKNVPGGVQICKNDGVYTSTYLSRGFVELTGYSQQEIQALFNNCCTKMVHPKDIRWVRQQVEQQLQDDGCYRIEYRLITKDGSVRWVLDSGRLVEDEEGSSQIYCVLVDITESRQAQQMLQLSEERYKVIMEHTDSIIYDWDLRADTVIFSGVWKKKFGYDPINRDLISAFSEQNIIHKQDLPTCLNMLHDISDGTRTYAEETMRIRQEDGRYIWCRNCLTAIQDANGVTCRAVGAIFDIDKEKRETECMQELAQKDCLTQLYNKGACERSICSILQERRLGDTHAFLIIDLDNFKRINDTLGHVWGDMALKQVAETLHQPFRSTDIVGRIGGDEFVAFICGATPQVAQKKAESICENFRSLFVGEDNSYQLSGSVGIALFPKDGISYEELYEHADVALYQAKAQGKNQLCFYGITEES